MNICIHHNDNDGRCSAAIVRSVFPDCKLIEMNYGFEKPWDQISKDDTVYLVDFSFEPFEDMLQLDNSCKLIWIDHHKSVIDLANKQGFNPEGLRVIGKSGCELTWEYLRSGQRIPIAVHFMGRFDVWDHSDPRVLPFQYGTLIEDMKPENKELWDKLLGSDEKTLDTIMKRGEICWQYQQQKDAEYIEAYHFEAEIDGLKAIVANAARCGSLLFKSLWDHEKYDVMIAFAYKPDGKITISAYTDKPGVDTLELATKFGGGGHQSASGWSADNLKTFLKQVGR